MLQDRKKKTSAVTVSAPIIKAELKRGKTKALGRGVLVSTKNLLYFEKLASDQGSKLVGKLINDCLDFLRSEMEAGKVQIHFKK